MSVQSILALKGSAVTTCTVGSTKIVYAKATTTIKKPAGVTQVTRLDGTSKPAENTVKVGIAPVRLS